MISYLKGEVVAQFDNNLNEIIIVPATGVGYKVFSLPIVKTGESVAMFVFHVIRENIQDLYGFTSMSQRILFEKLLSVKGVGPKSAFTLMKSLGVEQIIHAIKYEEIKSLTSAPRIGKKAASQIILDLAGKISELKIQLDRYDAQKNISREKKEQMNSSLNVSSLKDSDNSDAYDMIDNVSDIPLFDNLEEINQMDTLETTLQACMSLGFAYEEVWPCLLDLKQKNLNMTEGEMLKMVLKEMRKQ